MKTLLFVFYSLILFHSVIEAVPDVLENVNNKIEGECFFTVVVKRSIPGYLLGVHLGLGGVIEGFSNAATSYLKGDVGIRVGDRIVGINEWTFSNQASPDEISKALKSVVSAASPFVIKLQFANDIKYSTTTRLQQLHGLITQMRENDASICRGRDGSTARMDLLDGPLSILQVAASGALFGSTVAVPRKNKCHSGKVIVASPRDACSTLLMEASRVRNSILIVDRGGCTFHAKALMAAHAGATGVIFINNVKASHFSVARDDTLSSGPDPSRDPENLFAIMVDRDAGEKIISKWRL